MNPKLSICMPTFGHELFIEGAIKSVLNQSFEDFELIISDNNQDDKTHNVVKNFTDSRIKYLRNNKTISIQQNYNNCFRSALGDYISILPSDDRFRKNKSKIQVDHLDNYPDISCVFSKANLVTERGSPYLDLESRFTYLNENFNRPKKEWIKHFFFKGNCLFASTAMFRRSLFSKVGYFDDRFFQLHDFDFWIKSLIHGNIYIFEEELIDYSVLGMANQSSPNIDKSNRSNFELSQIYGVFSKFDRGELSCLSEKFYGIKDKNILIAMICIAEVDNAASKIYGLNYLYNHYNNFLKEGFTFQDFYKLTGYADVFNKH